MKINNHRLISSNGNAVSFVATPNQGGKIMPKFLVVHYTAGRSAQGSIKWLKNPAAKASAHLVIARNGAITQMVDFDTEAWHAGRSRWAGLTGLNGHSIGVELDNPGILQRREAGWTNYWGDSVDGMDVLEEAHKNGGPVTGWHTYSSEQLEALEDICLTLFETYTLSDIVGHDDIAPNRKSDPGPAFPMSFYRNILNGRNDDEPERYAATTRLNIRSGPGVDYEKLREGSLSAGMQLEIIAESGIWRHVDVLDELDGETHMTGWVHGHYITPV